MSNPSIVFSIQLDRKGGAEEKDTVDDRCHWVHIDYREPDAMEALAALGVNEWAVKALTRADTRSRAIFTPEGTLLVLRAINMNPGSEP
ncbi:MAG: zinc transporter [Candidatus Azotimanducaceae bacterium]|jgi:zinc transporter